MKRVVFLNITAFSIAGGIERFNKCMLKALSILDDSGKTNSCSLSAYDTEMSERYYPASKYRCYKRNKFLFLSDSLRRASKSDVVILGHINLALIGLMIKKLFPRKIVILATHGIDVWGDLNASKKKVLQQVDLILSVSNFTKQKMVEKHGIDKDKIEVFPNTIDPYFPIPHSVQTNNKLRERYGLTGEDFVLYTLTRLRNTELYKGYDKVIEAMKAVVANYPNTKYVLGGKYDPDEKERIERLIEENGLEQNVILTGFLEESELVPHYQMADTYIMPSKKEGFGIVFIEALVCGTPVIAGNADGSADALLQGELGTLVNPDSIKDITTAIINHIESNPKKDKEKRLNTVNKTLEHFSFEKYTQRLERILATC